MTADWDAFVGWIKEYMKLPQLPIKWSTFEKDDFKIVRIDLCPGKAYQVTTAVEDRPELCNDGVAYLLSQGLMVWLSKAIETQTPYTYFRYFPIKVVV